MSAATDRPAAQFDGWVDARTRASDAFFSSQARRIAEVCHEMAERFAREGRLIACGAEPAARSDARHVAVEFVHPVIVGKRALPALAVCSELESTVALLARPDDIVMGFGAGSEAAVGAARARGCLTIGFAAGSGAEHGFVPAGTPDPAVRQELAETTYHLLWELSHVFFDHRGLLSGRTRRETHDAGASSFLYPFLDEREDRLEPVLADVAGSVTMKAAEIAALRAQTVCENAGALRAAADALRACVDAGGQLLALGNGGSATDAMDVVADFRSSAHGHRARAAIDLTDDSGILTAIANDIGVPATFTRQVIAHGRAGDALIAFSTSGGSANVVAALAQARRQGLHTIAFVGYDGGAIAADSLADDVIITRSEHIPRIQEAQATAYHLLRELVG